MRAESGAGQAALPKGEYQAELATAEFAGISVSFTHQVGDGLHSAFEPWPRRRDPNQAMNGRAWAKSVGGRAAL